MIRSLLFLALLGGPARAADDDDDNKGETEVEVPLAELPAAVKKAIEARWPGAVLEEAEREGKVFEVEFKTRDGKQLEAKVTPTGEIQKVEDESDEDEDDDD